MIDPRTQPMTLPNDPDAHREGDAPIDGYPGGPDEGTPSPKLKPQEPNLRDSPDAPDAADIQDPIPQM